MPLLGVTTPAGPLRAPWPGLVISCGNVAAPVAAALRVRGVPAVHVQHPKLDPARFDAVVAARHDELSGPNVVVTRTALHRASPERLAAARTEWEPRLAYLPRPLVAVLVGGSNGRFRLDLDVAARLANQLDAMMRFDHVGLAITPSRRTAPEVVSLLGRHLHRGGAYVWDRTGENPYFGLLAIADAIVVTCDSVSMMSEAAATRAPMFIFELPGRSRRIGNFVDMLIRERRAHPFTGRLRSWPVTPIDDTAEAAAEVMRRLHL
jgi:mitochondrial fission protein ELM1